MAFAIADKEVVECGVACEFWELSMVGAVVVDGGAIAWVVLTRD